jgi:hypothetical protein
MAIESNIISHILCSHQEQSISNFGKMIFSDYAIGMDNALLNFRFLLDRPISSISQNEIKRFLRCIRIDI